MIKKYVTRRQRAEERKNKIKKTVTLIVAILVVVITVVVGKGFFSQSITMVDSDKIKIPEYNGQAYCEINDNKPFFTEEDLNRETFESYSDLDSLGRCGVAFANISKELMPIEERGEIGSIKPSGWVQAKYEGIVNSSPPYLYNRCHLIAHCLTAENANEKNLITGTRYMNVEGMLPFEEKVAQYLDNYDNHVLYRVTPIFEGSNLVADGVLMEAYSVEDSGKGVCFCVFVYNVQPGIIIDYSNGESQIKK